MSDPKSSSGPAEARSRRSSRGTKALLLAALAGVLVLGGFREAMRSAAVPPTPMVDFGAAR